MTDLLDLCISCRSPNQRNKKASGEKPKKQLAPEPPLDKQRSKSAPSVPNVPNSVDITLESVNAVSISENNKLIPPPKKMVKSMDAEYIDNERNDSLEEAASDALCTHAATVGRNEEILQGSPLLGHKKLQRSKALENAQSNHENNDDETSNEVFAPVDPSPESNSKTPSPRLRILRQDSYSSLIADPPVEARQKSTEKDSPDTGSVVAAAAGKQSAKDAAKPSIMQHLRKSSISEVITSSSSFINFNKNRNLDIKSKTLPADKVSLRQIRFTSQDREEEDGQPCMTEAAEAKQKPRPKVPPRSPQRDKKVPDDEMSRSSPLEDTHL